LGISFDKNNKFAAILNFSELKISMQGHFVIFFLPAGSLEGTAGVLTGGGKGLGYSEAKMAR